MSDLDSFLRAAKVQGASDDFLVALLHQQGWPQRTVYEALGRYYVELTGRSIPAPRSTLEAAREAFYHLLAFGTLATWIFSMGYIWFGLIDSWLPDTSLAGNPRFMLREVSWQIAAIVIAFPVFAYATRHILSDLTTNPEKIASPIRRWLTNIALLITALVFIGDLVSFLATFLQGELSSRFLLKSLVVFILSGGVFLYYTRGLGARDVIPGFSWHRRFAVSAGLTILLTLGFGFSETGSPFVQRTRAQDRRRVEDLRRIATAIHERWYSARTLPAALAELNPGSPAPQLSLTDPVTHQPYSYIAGTESNYQLCAVFSLGSETSPSGARPAWSHTSGRSCFPLQAAVQPPYEPFY